MHDPDPVLTIAAGFAVLSYVTRMEHASELAQMMIALASQASSGEARALAIGFAREHVADLQRLAVEAEPHINQCSPEVASQAAGPVAEARTLASTLAAAIAGLVGVLEGNAAALDAVNVDAPPGEA